MSQNVQLASSNTVWQQTTVTRQRRQSRNHHRSVVLWFTGLSGAGKSTLAHAVEEALHQQDCQTVVLDGDNMRHGLCSDLGFDLIDRAENIRRVGEVAKLFVEAGFITLAAFISPLRADRDLVRQRFATADFFEIYCDDSLEICEQRDTKGFYRRARAGEIKEFTGISSPYEKPDNQELTIFTGQVSLDACVQQVLTFLHDHCVVLTESSL
jgi:adenylylsulfate kinase